MDALILVEPRSTQPESTSINAASDFRARPRQSRSLGAGQNRRRWRLPLPASNGDGLERSAVLFVPSARRQTRQPHS